MNESQSTTLKDLIHSLRDLDNITFQETQDYIIVKSPILERTVVAGIMVHATLAIKPQAVLMDTPNFCIHYKRAA